MSMNIKFWGVRGSIASPGPETALVGGNTPCVEVATGDTRLVLDAGTGLRRFGASLAGGGPVDVTVLLSHVHWDHIQGIPFFGPIYAPGTKLTFVSGATGSGPTGAGSLREALHHQMRAPHFPVDLDDLPSTLTFREVRHGARFSIGDAVVTAVRANHPDAVFAYRIEHAGRSIVYATDTEHYSCVDRRLLALAEGADVLVYDAQYLPEEYSGEVGPSRVSWGHSTFEAAAALAQAASVSQLLLFHHDPIRTDDAVVGLERRAQALFANTTAAREGMVVEVARAQRDPAARDRSRDAA